MRFDSSLSTLAPRQASSSLDSAIPAGTTLYHEPGVVTLAILVSLLYLANVARGLAQRLVGAGLLGEIAVGVVYAPLARLLPAAWLDTFLVLGYLGLVLIVFEGGLTLQPRAFLPHLPLAVVVALAGILLPLAFTFALFSAPTFAYPARQAFTVGSALASTSLGTTFLVLRTAAPELGSTPTAVAEILKGAALLDDVVALVLLSVIQALATPSTGGGAETVALGWTIGRPVLASVALAVLTPIITRWILLPVFRSPRVEPLVARGGRNAELFLGVSVLCAFLSIAYYAGTTMLLGAFLAGACLSALPSPSSGSTVSFVRCWDLWLVPLQEHIFVPLFFISIGFSLPFLDLWTGARIWRGVVYAILMTLGKVLAGVPILVVELLRRPNGGDLSSRRGSVHDGGVGGGEAEMGVGDEAGVRATSVARNTRAENKVGSPGGDEDDVEAVKPQTTATTTSSNEWGDSLCAAGFVGLALVARGEIGVLVLQLAYSSARDAAAATTTTTSSPILTEEAYLVGIWAVALCTIVGPVAFGAMVRRYGGRIRRSRWGERT